MAKTIDIKDTQGNVRFSTPINTGGKRVVELMKEDYIVLKFSLTTPILFPLGDYVDDPDFGLFEVTDVQKPDYNTGTGGYDYNLKLEASYYKWKNKIFKYTPEYGGQEAAWNLTAPIGTHLDVFLRNLSALGYTYKGTAYTVVFDSTVDTSSSKLVSYDNTNLIDALTAIAEAFSAEWWVIGSAIHFGRCEYGTDPVEFRLGDNVAKITRNESENSYATRIYAFGSTRNIPPTYRKELYFIATSVADGILYDQTRPLDISYFPKADTTAYLNKTIPFSREESTKEQRISFNTALATAFPAGDCVVDLSGIQISAQATDGKKFSCTYTIALVSLPDATVVHRIETGTATSNEENKVVFSLPRFELTLDAPEEDMAVGISVTSDKADYALTVSDDCKLSSPLRATAKVTVLSGTDSGKSYNCVYNPNNVYGDSANVLQLPSGTSIKAGDRYEISNLIKGRVPSYYFSGSEDTDVTVNGVVQKRLMLPKGVISIDSEPGLPMEQYVERVLVFDDIYPRTDGTVTLVTTYRDEIEDENGKGTGEYETYYRFKDADLAFSSEYIIEGEELHVIFQSGLLRGMEFAVEYNDGEAYFEIVVNEDYGRQLPDTILYPKVGDKYVLTGWDSTNIADLGLVEAAEQELYTEAKKEAEKIRKDPSVYSCVMMPDYIYGTDPDTGNLDTDYAPGLELGDKTYLVDIDFTSRIIGYEYPLDKPYDNPTYKVGESAAYSRLGEMEGKIESLTMQGRQFGLTPSAGGTYIIGTNDSTAPSNRNVFSALRQQRDFLRKDKDDRTPHALTVGKDLTVEGNASTTGHAKVGGNLSVIQDASVKGSLEVEELVKALGGVRYGDSFVPGLLGKGGLIDGEGRGELRALTLWESLTVPELKYNKVNVYTGIRWDTFGAGCIDRVILNEDGVSGSAYLRLNDGEMGTIEAYDLCMGIWHDHATPAENETEDGDDRRGNFTFAGFKTVYFMVTGVPVTDDTGEDNTDRHFFTYELRDGTTAHPTSQMNFACRGNLINEERQSFIYTTTKYSLMLSGVNQWEFTDSMYMSAYGYLEGFTIQGKEFHGWGVVLGNAYIFGQIDQFERPAAYEMRLTDTLGGFMQVGETDTLLAYIYNGYKANVTADYGEATWKITRDSGDATADAAWNASAPAVGFTDTEDGRAASFPIQYADLAGDQTAFTVSVTKDGEETIAKTASFA